MDCGVCIHISWENSRAMALNIVMERCSAYQQCHRKIPAPVSSGTNMMYLGSPSRKRDFFLKFRRMFMGQKDTNQVGSTGARGCGDIKLPAGDGSLSVPSTRKIRAYPGTETRHLINSKDFKELWKLLRFSVKSPCSKSWWKGGTWVPVEQLCKVSTN